MDSINVNSSMGEAVVIHIETLTSQPPPSTPQTPLPLSSLPHTLPPKHHIITTDDDASIIASGKCHVRLANGIIRSTSIWKLTSFSFK